MGNAMDEVDAEVVCPLGRMILAAIAAISGSIWGSTTLVAPVQQYATCTLDVGVSLAVEWLLIDVAMLHKWCEWWRYAADLSSEKGSIIVGVWLLVMDCLQHPFASDLGVVDDVGLVELWGWVHLDPQQHRAKPLLDPVVNLLQGQPVGLGFEAKFGKLLKLGFNREAVVQAKKFFDGNEEAATRYLFGG
ncbi:DNA damage-inducible protein 1-like protein [Tanacetum coccineum]